jgi:hypothetical protein
MHEYHIEHYGSLPVDWEAIKKRLGTEDLANDDFIAREIPDRPIVYFASSRSDRARIAFTKVIEYLLTISDSVSVHDQ